MFVARRAPGWLKRGEGADEGRRRGAKCVWKTVAEAVRGQECGYGRRFRARPFVHVIWNRLPSSVFGAPAVVRR